MQIERRRHMIRAGLVAQPLQNIKKAHDCVGILTVLGGQQLDAVKRAVGNAVAVQ